MKKLFGLSVLVILILQGCIPSLHPLYTKNDLVSYDKVLGQWGNSDEGEIWTFEMLADKDIDFAAEAIDLPDMSKAYYLSIESNSGKNDFVVHFVKLKDNVFADFFPVKGSSEKSDFFNLHMISAHTFAHASFNEGNLSLHMMDQDELKKAIRENRVRIRHEKTSQGYILTASTKELQQFVTKYADHEGAFESELNLERMRINE
ncbi:MAG: hypothetical protein AAF502_06190 [Bacteroidota bacterium]